MTTRLSTYAQIGAILCWFPMGCIAAVQLMMIALGHFDPVAHDVIPPKLMPAYYSYLAAQVFISSAGSAVVLWKTHGAQRILTKPLVVCWASQVSAWIVSVVACWPYVR